MTESHSQSNLGLVPEAAPANLTLPTAQTPADDRSDFYNTPLTAGTPAVTDTKADVAAEAHIAETPASTISAPQIPGLSLVNDSPQDSQTGQSDSNALENTNNADVVMTEAKEAQPVSGEPNPQLSEVPAQEDTDAMEVEQEKTQPQETAGSNGETNGTTNGNANEIAGTAFEAATAPAQAEQPEEGEEEHPEWELDSSPYESSSDSSDTDSSDSDDEDEDYPILSAEEQARILMQAEMGSDDEGEGKGKTAAALKTTNEVPEEVLPIPEVTITPEMKIVLLGNVEAAIENTILISANVSGEYQVLEAGSLLCLEDRRVAGVVSETLGRVENPLYAVRFPTAADVEQRGLSRGTVVYYVVEHSTFVFTQPLKGLKGSDASNFHDEEVAEDEVEFSDDEQEAEYRRRLKQKRQERKGPKNDNAGAARGRGPPGPSKLNQSELNYDDNAGEDGYTPLARPKNLHEMMRQEPPVENDGFANRHSGPGGGRGRGRGSDRGRGGRGRGRGGRDQHQHGHHSHHESQSHYQQDRPDAHRQHQHQHQHPQQPQPQQYPTYNQTQQYPSYPQQHQQPQPQPQQQQQPYAQNPLPTTPFNFQMPYQQAYQQAYQQPNPYQQLPNTPHINPLFLAALQQQQQQQQQQQHYQQQPQQPQLQQQQQQPGAAQPQAQNQAMDFDQVKAQLDLLRQLSNGGNGGQWPPRPQ
ncbi:Gar1/Naf1 RNA binding region-domain-containing protein [Aspergillus crustosus]